MPDQLAGKPPGATAAPLRLHVEGTSYLEAGTGEPIIFIHGVGLNADIWRPQLEEFSKTNRVICFDMLGHGQSNLPPANVELDDYVEQLHRLLQTLAIKSATIVGHSMGGLVAMGFALAFPGKVSRLAVLNSVYNRTAGQRQAVQDRASGMARSGSTSDIEQPLRRWFGEPGQQPAVAQEVRHMLASANPFGYAAAYGVFANADGAFAGKLHELSMPALFATGSEDSNSSPEMAHAMAAAAPNGKALVVHGERHMMALVNPRVVNAALRDLLRAPTGAIDPHDLRKAFGTFMTGVTVVTTREMNGSYRGFTANSFSSVSLDPPLLLLCLSKTAASYEVFSKAKSFAVNILAEDQKAVSGVFASKRPDKFSDVDWSLSQQGNPLISGSVAWFDCQHHNVVEAGDHVILIGKVASYGHNDASPLGYARGGYFTLGLEQSAVNAAAEAGRTEVGAVLECGGKLLVFGEPGGSFELPHVGRGGEAGTVSRLMAKLSANGIEANLSFLFAVYENREDHSQSIYYRGEAECRKAGTAVLLNFDELPWDKFRDNATRSMLQRYASERLQGRYRIYSGDQISGEVRDVGG